MFQDNVVCLTYSSLLNITGRLRFTNDLVVEATKIENRVD